MPGVTLEGRAGAGASLPGAAEEHLRRDSGWEVPARSKRTSPFQRPRARGQPPGPVCQPPGRGSVCQPPGRGSGVSPQAQCVSPQAKGQCVSPQAEGQGQSPGRGSGVISQAEGSGCGSLCSGTGRSWCLWSAGRSSCGQGSLRLISDAASTPPRGPLVIPEQVREGPSAQTSFPFPALLPFLS